MPTTPSHTVETTSSAVCVRVDLPDVRKASEVDLNISSTRLHLVASHEDCRGRRRVCLLRLRQEEDGALIQEAAWPLTLGA